MANFCPKCGGKINPGDMFCQNCGANVAGPAETPKVESVPEKPPAPVKTPAKYIIRDIIKACIQIFLLVLFLYWVWYSYNCAVGNYLNNGDQACQSIYQFFHSQSSGGGGGGGGGGGKTTSIGCQHCSPGYCWTGQACCPSSAQFYCNGRCYQTSDGAYNAGCHQSSWTRYCCP